MSTKLETRPVPTSNSNLPDDLFHTTCCDDDISLCGLDVSAYSETDGEGELFCIVCEDLYERDIPCSPICIYID